MRNKIFGWSIGALIAVVFAVAIGYFALVVYFSSEDGLVASFREQLIENDFSAMYEESSDFMKVNVTEAEFVHRMKVVAQTLRQYDPDLNFRRETELETSVEQVRRDSEPNGAINESAGYSFVILTIGTAERKARVHLSWTRRGLKPRLFDLSLGEHSLTDRINTVAGEPFTASR